MCTCICTVLVERTLGYNTMPFSGYTCSTGSHEYFVVSGIEQDIVEVLLKPMVDTSSYTQYTELNKVNSPYMYLSEAYIYTVYVIQC